LIIPAFLLLDRPNFNRCKEISAVFASATNRFAAASSMLQNFEFWLHNR